MNLWNDVNLSLQDAIEMMVEQKNAISSKYEQV